MIKPNANRHNWLSRFIKSLFSCEPDIKPGQVWEYTFDGGNPFKMPKTVRNVVVAVHGGYVQYYEEGREHLESARISWFKLGARRIA